MAAQPIIIDMPDTRAAESRAQDWRKKSLDLVIVDQATFEEAAELLKGINGLLNEAEVHHRPVIDAAHRAHKAALEALKRITTPLEEAQRLIKSRVSSFLDEQERKRREEQRRIEEEQAKAREAEIEAQLEAAEAAGASNAEVEAIIAQPVFAPPVVVPPTHKVEGIAQRENWKARVVDKSALVKAAAGNPMLMALLEVNQPALNSLARSMKSTLNVPGVEVYNDPIVSVRR